MPNTATLGDPKGLPKTLRAASLWKRFIIGTLMLIFGILAAAWIFDASIEKPSARFAVPALAEIKAERSAH